MNKFVRIKHIQSYKKVHYYSVCINDEKVSLFDKFIQKHRIANFEKFYHIFRWIEIIGNKYGAQEQNFRPEAEISDTSALPPKGKYRKPTYIENEILEANPLRLYCFRVSEKIVFLYNGEIKTALKAQDCPQVRPHFKLANVITKALEEAFRNKEIYWKEDYTDIEFDEELEIILE